MTVRRRLWAFLPMMLVCVAPGAFAQAVSTPAELRIEQARKQIEAKPDAYQAHNDLAMALTSRGRETGDPAYYDRAEEAVASALRLAPENLESVRIAILSLLGKHDVLTALERARALNKRIPDEVLVYALIVDAATELGLYDEAEQAAQWMLNLRAGSVATLTRVAHLRKVFGEFDGALDLMQQALNRVPSHESEEQAWMLVNMAHVLLSAGKTDIAEAALQRALAIFPNYHYALGHLAKVRIAQGRHVDAVDLELVRYRIAPHLENLYALAKALHIAGRVPEAQRRFADFERNALKATLAWGNANRELIHYYIDHALKPAEALRVAEREIARRRDVPTLDAYAWALQAAGKPAEARRQIEAALKVGFRDAGMLYRAGVIAARLGDRPAAVRYLRQSLDLSAQGEHAYAARRLLARVAEGESEVARAAR